MNRTGPWRALVLAFQLLSTVPLRLRSPPQEQDYGRSVLAYPLVGLVLGGLLMLADTLLATLPASLQAALLLALWVGFSGALHLDGLADAIDAWAGGHGDPRRTLAILKDPRAGPMAVAALIVTLLLKYSALDALLTDAPAHWLVAAPLLGRVALVAAFVFIPYARPDGIAAAHARTLPRYPALLVLLASLAVPPATGVAGALAVGAALAVFVLVRRAAIRRLGGFTGDVAGALCELTETAVLVTLSVVATEAAG